jgi:hypothetical protein
MRRAVGQHQQEAVSCERQDLFPKDGRYCVWCGADSDLQVDHVMPRAFGGGNGASNKRVLCGRCNQLAWRIARESGVVALEDKLMRWRGPRPYVEVTGVDGLLLSRRGEENADPVLLQGVNDDAE